MHVKIEAPEDRKPGYKEGSLMLDTIVLALALLLGSVSTTLGPVSPRDVGNRPPAGGIPIPQRGPGLGVQ